MRVRALRGPILLGSLPRKTGRCAPPRPAHRSFADPSGDINDEGPKRLYYKKIDTLYTVCTRKYRFWAQNLFLNYLRFLIFLF
jgi:hypothetical protein